jgi:dolichol-phosphate mannosyltransferase
MRRFPLGLALIVVLLAIFGALLHPLALALSVAPLPTKGFVTLLQEVRSYIADLLGWGVLGALVVMATYVVSGRLFNRSTNSELAKWFTDLASVDADPPSNLRVVVAITAYNDAEATAEAARDFGRQPSVIKVLVIDNNSTDRTSELATAAGATVIREPRQGYGYTCIRGLTEGLLIPEADVIVLTEGDGTFVAEDTAKFLAYVDSAEFVVGNRVVRGLVAQDSQMDHFFTWGNMVVALLLRLRYWDGRFLGPAGLSDVGCTFRAIRRRPLERIISDLAVGGNHFSPHMLLVALAHGISVVEIPIRFRRRVGESKGASQSFRKGLQVGVAMIWHIMTFTSKSAGQKPGVVVERDGVIIKHVQNGGPAQVEFARGAMDGLASLSRNGHSVIVIGDRSHNDRAGISPKVAKAINARIAAEVEHRGGHVDAFVVCPHRANQRCSCRHPQPRILLKAARQAPLDFTKAVVVSDRVNFLEAAAGLGCETILVGNGGSKLLVESRTSAHAADLAGAVELVLATDNRPKPS